MYAGVVALKKSIVAGLVILALIVLISPGLVGKLAERSVEDQLRWAAEENEEVVVTAESFTRGWFSSEGRHRVSIGELAQKMGLGDLGIAPGAGEAPTLVIETRLDHGLIPVSSMSREDGSLVPGLGRAVSTLALDRGDGELVSLPGKVFSRVGLDGGLHSRYALEPGSMEALTWGTANIEVDANAARRTFAVDGRVDTVALAGDDDSFDVGDLDVAMNLRKVDQGFSVGTVEVNLAALTISPTGGEPIRIGPLDFRTSSALSGRAVNASTRIDVTLEGAEPVGDIGWQADIDVRGVDADAYGALNRKLDSLPDSTAPEAALSLAGEELAALIAAGVELDIGRLDISLPQGTVRSAWTFTLPETESRGFSWTSALLALEGKGDIEIPIAVFEYAATLNPDLGAVLGMGFLKKSGDDYVMNAEYRKGLLTVNGAPMPVPLPGP